MAHKAGSMMPAVTQASDNIKRGKVTGKVVGVHEDYSDKSKVRVEIADGPRDRDGYQPTSTIVVSASEAADYAYGKNVTINTEVQVAPEGGTL